MPGSESSKRARPGKTKAQGIATRERGQPSGDSPGSAAFERTATGPARGENDELLQIIFNGMSDSIFLVDPENDQIVDANASACGMLQYTREELLDLKISDVHPLEMDRLKVFAEQVFERGEGRTDEFSCLTKSGDFIPAELAASRITLRGRQLMLVVARDISLRKRAEAEIKASESRFRDLIEGSIQGIFIIDEDGRPLFVNQAAAQIFGYESPEDILALDSVQPMFAPHERDRIRAYRKARFRGEDTPTRFEFQGVRKDGSLIWLQNMARIVEWEGKRVTQATLVDITERKRAEDVARESEEKYRSLVDLSPDAILVQQGGKVVFANLSAITLYRADGPEQLIGKKTVDLVHPQDRQKMLERRETLRHNEKLEVTAELLCLRLDGTTFYGESIGATIPWHGHPAAILVIRDQTARQRTEELLGRAEERLRNAIESISEGFALYDAEDRLTLCNSKYRQIYTESDDLLVIGARFEDIVREGMARNQYTAAVGREEEWLAERLAAHRDPKGPIEQRLGDGRWLLIEERRTRDGGTVGIRTDITALKRVEEALRRNKARLADAQRMANLGSWEMEVESGKAIWSDEQYRIFGYRPGEIEPSFEAVKAAVHPADRDAFVEQYRRARDEGREKYENEYRIVRPDGSQRFIHSSAEITREDAGKPVKLVGTVHDITERKRTEERLRRAEERLRDAIESIADGFVLFDAEDRVMLWNQQFADMYPELLHMLASGATAEEMFRERYRVGAVGKFDVPVDDYVRWRLEMRRKQGGTPAVHRHSDGRWFRTTERKTSEGGIVAISTDITVLKNREAESRAAKEQAEFANRSKSEFLANMSHELRTPLNAVIGFSEVMQQEMFGPLGAERYGEYARDIHDSGTHLLSLISDILDLAKIEAGKLELREENVNVADAVSVCRRIVEGRAKEAEISLATRLSGNLPRLFADERAVKQIVLNLLSNAVKFTPAGGMVTVHAEVDEVGCFVLSVSDTGIGIGVDDIPKVLMPFGQVDGSVSREHEGTGLGLPLVKSLVESHGGTIELESELGDGTIATIRFPAERVLDDPAETEVDKFETGAA